MPETAGVSAAALLLLLYYCFTTALYLRSNFREAQMIDVFGEIAGVSFSPDNHALFLGIADRTYGKAEGRRQKAEKQACG